jgi:hypothetical protein
VAFDGQYFPQQFTDVRFVVDGKNVFFHGMSVYD